MRFHYLIRVVHERFDLLKRNLTPSHFLNGMLGDSEVQTQQFFTRDPLQPTPATYRYIFNANNGVGHGKRRRSNGWQVIVANSI
jgi:hypothetical protein